MTRAFWPKSSCARSPAKRLLCLPWKTPPIRGKNPKEAWNDWFKVRGPALVLGKPTSNQRYLGYTLLVCIDPNTNMGSLVELGAGNKKRWQIDGLNYPWGAGPSSAG